MNKKIIMSDEKADMNNKIVQLGYEIIPTDKLSILHPFEQRHADMQSLLIKDSVFVLKEAENLISKLKRTKLNVIITQDNIQRDYPDNIALNAVYINNKLFGKVDSIDLKVKEYCLKNNIELINVNQGYTKCSTAIFGSCFITADKGIFDSMTESGEEGLLIQSGDIALDGVDYGFIGGCSFYDNNTAYFTGDIKKHKSYNDIQRFLSNRKINIECLTNKKLYDIGGFIII